MWEVSFKTPNTQFLCRVQFYKLPLKSNRVKVIKNWFAVHESPEEIHSDNGPQFTSQQFREFAKEWDFKHVTGSPHHHQSNGLAEKFVDRKIF
jgi:transposase InsO family protein